MRSRSASLSRFLNRSMISGMSFSAIGVRLSSSDQTVRLHIVEPYLVRAAVSGLGEDQDSRADARVGLEHARGHGDHRLEPVVLDQRFADRLMRLGRAEEYAVGYDAGAASAHAQHPEKQRDEEQLGLLRLADLQEISRYRVIVQTALERRIGEDQAVLALILILVAQAVAVFDIGAFDAVGHHVHRADTQHGAIHVVAEEHVVHVMILLLLVEEDIFLVRFFQIFRRRDQKARGAARGIADHVLGGGLHELYHHADDMARGAELTVHARLRDLAEQIFVGIAADVGALLLVHQFIDRIERVDDLGEHERSGDHKDRVVHVFGIGAVLVRVEVLDERENIILHDGVHPARGKIVEHRPLERFAVDLAPRDIHFIRKDALERQSEHGTFLCLCVIRVVEIVDKHQVGDLLDDRQRVDDTARREDFPYAVDFTFQFSCNHASFSLFQV